MLISCQQFKHADERCRLLTSSLPFQRKQIRTNRQELFPAVQSLALLTGSSDTFASKHYLNYNQREVPVNRDNELDERAMQRGPTTGLMDTGSAPVFI